ncbi:hypothetical protein Aperf_G00000085300 [Anoplocephala perfoliata]
MSWREMRNFTEMMRTLGYPRLISMEHFRSPNFPLVVEILTWLAKRFDPNSDIPKCIDSEQDRVIFIKIIIQFMATKAFVKLNPKRLYKADGYAVKELLKIVNLLYSALKSDERAEDEDNQGLNLAELLGVERVKQLQHTRYLASQLTSMGASLHSFMTREADFRQSRNEAISRQLDVEWVEKCLKGACDAIRDESSKLEKALANVKADEGTLDGKIEKRRSELERNQKRLSTLQSVRPAYMEEFEQLEEELNTHYEIYLTNFRNLMYLENLKEELMHSEDAKIREDDELRKITEDADNIFSNSEVNNNEDIFSAKSRNAIVFSNTNAGSARSLDDSNSSSGLVDSEQLSSSDSVTDDSETDSGRECDANDNDDVIRGLSIVGTGYRISGNWTPGRSREKLESNSSSPFGIKLHDNFSALKRDDGEQRQDDVDRAFAEALAEANKLTEEIENEEKLKAKLGATRNRLGSPTKGTRNSGGDRSREDEDINDF